MSLHNHETFTNIENVLLNSKRFRDDFNNNISPKISPTMFNTFTPLLEISEGFPQLFLFNNSNLRSTSTSNTYTPSQLFLNTQNNNFINFQTNRLDESIFNYSPDLKTLSKKNSKTESITNQESPLNNFNDKVINSDNPSTGRSNCTPNVGFYNWVFQGGPQLLQSKKKNTKKLKNSNYLVSHTD